ncbi:MAG: CCA tRNA nucleotidyltransferase [Dehalococcoidales bacterium]|nr:MAG: CCA tRNA nucleotidyltransferase [Dehalococcoidales bacterium]
MVKVDGGGDLRSSLNRLQELSLWPFLTRIIGYLNEHRIKSYVVGGLLRDMMLGRVVADIDIAVTSDGPGTAAGIASAIGGKHVILDKINRIGRVVVADQGAPSGKGQWEFDFTAIKENIEQDLARRDFTVNAMAIDTGQIGGDVPSLQLIDPFNGLDDLEKGVIRVVSETALESDALRLMRAIRLAAELGFSISQPTETLIQASSHLLAGVAGERVRDELLRLMVLPGAGESMLYLDKLCLLTVIFPELAKTKEVEQPKEHYWDVFGHSLRTVAAVEFLLRQGTLEYAGNKVLAIVPWSDMLSDHFNQKVSSSPRSALIKLAALLHDIAKPQTRAIDAAGRMRFIGHANEGAVMIAGLLSRLRFSVKEAKLVETMVKHHLRPGQMAQEGLPTSRAIYRYFRDTEGTGIDILFLNLADHLATRGPNLILSNWKEHARMTEYVLLKHLEEESITRPAKLVDGHDIIDVFAINPGPQVGELLEAVREAQAAGEITTREEALGYIHDCLLSKAG